MDADQKKLLAQCDGIRKMLTGALAQLDALETKISADPSERQVVKAVLTAFDQLRAQRYNEPYVFAGAKDAAHAKRLLKQVGREVLWAKMRLYIKSNDPFYVKTRHSWGCFVSAVNTLASSVTDDGAPASRPADCNHQPPCKTDVEHTRRRRQDLRA